MNGRNSSLCLVGNEGPSSERQKGGQESEAASVTSTTHFRAPDARDGDSLTRSSFVSFCQGKAGPQPSQNQLVISERSSESSF